MGLTGNQVGRLREALIKAYFEPEKLRQMLRIRLDKNLSAIAIGHDLEFIIFRVIETADAEEWVEKIVEAARASNPGNLDLFAFAQELNLASIPPELSKRSLEKIIKQTNIFIDVNEWREKLGKLEAQVCRIEITKNNGRQEWGTGFLIAPNVIITNYHVVESVIEGQAAPKDVILRFDYKQIGDSKIINPGTEYRLAEEDWLIDSSPYVREENRLPTLDELDYALLRVDGVPGNEPIGKKAELGSPNRGWIELPTQPYEFLQNTPLFILQHPKARALKLAFDTDAIIGVNENGTTVTYKTNTEPGSSGSPCFDIKWNLVALHHSGDPNWRNPTYNAGTPFSAICSRLNNKDDLLTDLRSGEPI